MGGRLGEVKDSLGEERKAAPININTLGLQHRPELFHVISEGKIIVPRAVTQCFAPHRGDKVRCTGLQVQACEEPVCCRSEVVQIRGQEE